MIVICGTGEILHIGGVVRMLTMFTTLRVIEHGGGDCICSWVLENIRINSAYYFTSYCGKYLYFKQHKIFVHLKN